MTHVKTLSILLMIGSTLFLPGQAEGESMTIENGTTVSLNYTLTVEGQIIDSSEGGAPLQYVHGEDNMIPGLERELEGLKAGDEKTVQVSPDEAYGPVNPDAFTEVPREQMPTHIDLEQGMMLQMQTPEGHPVPVTITEIRDDIVVLDMNHPLAGKTLTFDIQVVSVDR